MKIIKLIKTIDLIMYMEVYSSNIVKILEFIDSRDNINYAIEKYLASYNFVQSDLVYCDTHVNIFIYKRDDKYFFYIRSFVEKRGWEIGISLNESAKKILSKN